ncbi:hydroxymethylpyrimidine kinase /phosphomethylpyrimidine kinase [Rhizobiales bacterium GAS191]|nr:hydroxymethylpyrimidine kinase /phosphomethylpyrimidine kinase [Rhizobiales bacterium GAS191]
MSVPSLAAARSTPIAVTIAGSDSGGGAGIQADIKTFSALGVYGASVITALTAQNTQGVFGIHDVPAEFVVAQIDAVYSDLDIDATKIGMLSRLETIIAVAERLRHWQVRSIVLDPLMIATSGTRLLALDAVEALKGFIFPLAAIVTPNLQEAAALLGESIAQDETAMARQAERLMRLGARAVLVKGGHGEGSESVDILAEGAGITRFAAPRLATPNTHGTGCTLSSAIAAGLARGVDLLDAVVAAKAYLTEALAAADRLKVGRGAGPLHHFHAKGRG